MQLWLDTINLDLIKEAAASGILTGVTTNPAILGQSDTIPEKKLQQLLAIQNGYVAAQVVAHDLEGILTQARRLAQLSGRLIVKIPVNSTGIKAIAILSKEGISTLATAVFEPGQVYLAALAGAHYVAPYLSRIAEEQGCHLATIASMLQIIEKNKFPIKLMAAAIRSKQQIIACAESGVQAITLPDKAYHELLSTYYLTETSLKEFDRAWASGNHTQESALFQCASA